MSMPTSRTFLPSLAVKRHLKQSEDVSCPFHKKFRQKKGECLCQSSCKVKTVSPVFGICLLFLAAGGCWCSRVQLLSSPPAFCFFAASCLRTESSLCECISDSLHSAFLSPNILIIRRLHRFCSAVGLV